MFNIKNKYKIIDDYVIIYLNNKTGIHETMIDLEDFKKVMDYPFKWYPSWNKPTKSYYARATTFKGRVNGKKKYSTIYMHQFIIELKDGKEYDVDHKDHNTLNNRKYNLKVTKRKRNTLNRKGANSNSTSGERNVNYVSRDNIWRVQFYVDDEHVTCGDFAYDDLDKAIVLARRKREELYQLKNYLTE